MPGTVVGNEGLEADKAAVLMAPTQRGARGKQETNAARQWQKAPILERSYELFSQVTIWFLRNAVSLHLGSVRVCKFKRVVRKRG